MIELFLGVLLLAVAGAIVGTGVYVAQQRIREQAIQREQFRAAVLHRLNRPDRAQFRLSQLVQESGVPKRLADEVAERI